MRSIGDVARPVHDAAGPVREAVGPLVHRVRRELQWRAPRYRVRKESGGDFPHELITHATPLMRRLAGVDPDLQRGKVTNLRLAVARLDGLVVEPGRWLSFWRQVGVPSRRRGFVDGMVLSHGQIGAGVGGGMCQLTNLLYWMTLHTPLTVVERWRHSYDVFPDVGRTQPFGSGATCAWPVLDLQVTNRTSWRFRLGLEVTGTDLVGRWTADAPVPLHYEVYEAGHVITNDLPGVFVRRNTIRRRVLDEGVEVGDEAVAVNEARLMYAPFLERGA